MRFVVDAQLPPALARWLTDQGHNAEHVANCGLASASDRAIWDYAATNGAVIITKDEDFAVRKALAQGPPPIVWLRMGNTRRLELLRKMTLLLPSLVASLQRGDSLIEVD